MKNKHPFKKKKRLREIIKTKKQQINKFKKQQLINAAIGRILVYIFDCVQQRLTMFIHTPAINSIIALI